MLTRYLSSQIKKDLNRKMVFVGGPRQIGKTTLAKSLLTSNQGYLNWDIPEDRERILKGELCSTKLWVFDEIHKYRSWRNFLKGIYDNLPLKHKSQILVTGSARLDYYRYSGDSLQGRYYYLRLHPLSLAELNSNTSKDLVDLLTFGGFPEPFFTAQETETKRWSREYRNRLIREDLVQIERVRDLGNLELLSIRLPELVGSPLSINSLREDLQLSHKTVAIWLQILERLYAIFRISPFGAPKIRAVKKEQKHYHFDWTVIQDMSKRFENLVASALLKWTHFRQDVYGEELELRYFRDIDGREVDFVLVERKTPLMFIECKLDDAQVSAALKYLKIRFPNCEAWQISAFGKKDFTNESSIRVAPAVKLLSQLI
ncbi:MAG: AAA family ATPase [Coxiellaceae bacterium]|jgi:predicted AAA+ superfamily ATPase|nr:AAA family ATPase [Coxiellaceae bacterium]